MQTVFTCGNVCTRPNVHAFASSYFSGQLRVSLPDALDRTGLFFDTLLWWTFSPDSDLQSAHSGAAGRGGRMGLVQERLPRADCPPMAAVRAASGALPAL